MTVALIIILIVFALYLIFIVFPGIVSSAIMFSKKNSFYKELPEIKNTNYGKSLSGISIRDTKP